MITRSLPDTLRVCGPALLACAHYSHKQRSSRFAHNAQRCVALLSALIQLVSGSTTHDPWRSTPVTRGRRRGGGHSRCPTARRRGAVSRQCDGGAGAAGLTLAPLRRETPNTPEVLGRFASDSKMPWLRDRANPSIRECAASYAPSGVSCTKPHNRLNFHSPRRSAAPWRLLGQYENGRPAMARRPSRSGVLERLETTVPPDTPSLELRIPDDRQPRRPERRRRWRRSPNGWRAVPRRWLVILARR
jgi:hypothetical protein